MRLLERFRILHAATAPVGPIVAAKAGSLQVTFTSGSIPLAPSSDCVVPERLYTSLNQAHCPPISMLAHHFGELESPAP
jgi:enamine deaminase RidA (YjgF/YER057c/UK114 family)